jgi:ABC-2 type transport system ATP-binding protein
MISFSQVSFTYRGDWLQRVHALSQTTFAVPSGASYGFLGANGAGKSTCIKILLGLLQGHRGDIRLFGKPLGDVHLRRRLGYLPEQPFFYDNLAVGEYLVYLARLSGIGHGELQAACDRVC